MLSLIRLSAFSGQNCEPVYVKGLNPEEDLRRANEKVQKWIEEQLNVKEIDDWQQYYLDSIYAEKNRLRNA